MKRQRDVFLRHAPCPACESRDNLSVYKSGFACCESCGKNFPHYDESEHVSPTKATMGDTEFLTLTYKDIGKRNLALAVCQRYCYGYATNKNGDKVQVANYYDKGKLVAQHTRTADKKFAWIGNTESLELFGQQLFRQGGKRIYITEGEIDCLTVSQVLGNTWPVVSIPNGAKSAKKYLERNQEYLESFQEIVLCFDMDQPGQEAKDECTVLFTPGKVRHVTLGEKDPSALHSSGKTSELILALKEARVYRPDGVLTASDIPLKALKNVERHQGYIIPYPDLQSLLRGFRKGELTTFAGGSGMGKTTLVRECVDHLNSLGARVGYVALEENKEKSLIALIAMHNNVPFGEVFLDRSILNDEQWETGYNRYARSDSLYLYDHFGSLDSDNLVSKLRYLAVGCKCDFLVLDHVSIVVSGISEGDERRIIDNLMTQLRSLAENTGVGILIISHLRAPDKGKSHEEGGRVTANQLRGSGSIKQLSDNIIAVEGNQQGKQPNLRLLRLLKNRLFGKVGPAGTLAYIETTGRLINSELVYTDVVNEKEF